MNNIKLANMYPGVCPFCGGNIRGKEVYTDITLNNQTKMKQPCCENDLKRLLTKEGQEQILAACQTIWLFELADNEVLTDEEKVEEIKRIKNLEVIYE
jgi:hypothetical protein